MDSNILPVFTCLASITVVLGGFMYLVDSIMDMMANSVAELKARIELLEKDNEELFKLLEHDSDDDSTTASSDITMPEYEHASVGSKRRRVNTLNETTTKED